VNDGSRNHSTRFYGPPPDPRQPCSLNRVTQHLHSLLLVPVFVSGHHRFQTRLNKRIVSKIYRSVLLSQKYPCKGQTVPLANIRRSWYIFIRVRYFDKIYIKRSIRKIAVGIHRVRRINQTGVEEVQWSIRFE